MSQVGTGSAATRAVMASAGVEAPAEGEDGQVLAFATALLEATQAEEVAAAEAGAATSNLAGDAVAAEDSVFDSALEAASADAALVEGLEATVEESVLEEIVPVEETGLVEDPETAEATAVDDSTSTDDADLVDDLPPTEEATLVEEPVQAPVVEAPAPAAPAAAVPARRPAVPNAGTVTPTGPPGVTSQIPASAFRWLDQHGWTVEWRQGPGPGRVSEAQYSTNTIVIWYETRRSDTLWAGAFAHELGHAVSWVHFGTQQMDEWNAMRGIASWRWVPGTPNDFSVGEGDFAEAFMSYLLGHQIRSVGGPLTAENIAWISANTPF